jgi:glycosyltransferase involved in cell wall biosynthesis
VRVTYLIPYFAPAWAYGGPPRLAYDMARHLTERGHVIDVLTTDALDNRERASSRRETLDGISVTRFPNLSNWLAWKYKIFLPVGFGRALGGALEGAQVAHMFDFRDYQNAVALSKLRRAHVPYVLSALGELPRATGPKRWMKLVFDVLYGWRLIRHAAALLAQTEDEASWYCRLGARPSQIRQVPLAVDLEAIDDSRPRGAFRQAHGIAATDKMVLFLGRIHTYKGVDLLIRAFAGVAAARPDVCLVIAGRDDGALAELESLARRLVPGKVVFSGPVYGEARFDAYRDADLFAITPSHAEQTSLAALEACACGTPTLVTEQAPIPGLDTAGAGLTVPYDVDAVRGALFQLLDADRATMGPRAAEMVRERFSWPAVVRVVEATYVEAARR